MKEEWRNIVGFEGYYEVSNIGNVRSTENHKAPVYNGKGGNTKSQWISNSGYKMVTLWVKGKRKGLSVHSAMLKAFKGVKGKGIIARHIDGDKLNNVIGNLQWGTYKQNHLDKKRHGTFQNGEKHGMSKLTEKEVIEIINSDLSGAELGRIYHVTKENIYYIKKGQAWKHIARTQQATNRNQDRSMR